MVRQHLAPLQPEGQPPRVVLWAHNSHLGGWVGGGSGWVGPGQADSCRHAGVPGSLRCCAR